MKRDQKYYKSTFFPSLTIPFAHKTHYSGFPYHLISLTSLKLHYFRSYFGPISGFPALEPSPLPGFYYDPFGPIYIDDPKFRIYFYYHKTASKFQVISEIPDYLYFVEFSMAPCTKQGAHLCRFDCNAHLWSLPYWGIPTVTRPRHFSESEMVKSTVYEEATKALEPSLQNEICRFLFLPPLPFEPAPLKPISCTWGKKPAQQLHVTRYWTKFKYRQHHREWIGPNCKPHPPDWEPHLPWCTHCRSVRQNVDNYICPNCDTPPNCTSYHKFIEN